MKETIDKKLKADYNADSGSPPQTPSQSKQQDWAGVIIDKIAGSPGLKLTLIVVAVAAVVAVGIRIYTNLKGPETTAVNQAVLTVGTEKAAIRPFSEHLKVSGTIWARDHLTVGAEIGGLKVDSIKAEEGDFVKEGQVLATLNSSILRAQLSGEEARLTRARANLDKTIQPNRPMDIARLEFAVSHANAVISQEEANVVRAKANLQNARQNTLRYKKLRTEGAVSQEDLDNRQTTENTMT
ncbi:MAG TPA: biotin/lipoyl-binding protein, partial [Candidatus Melainabacteria bacterium]|nr:biotin/lipoyl-binding protein [Candidatus Melainabacteria bacterium]